MTAFFIVVLEDDGSLPPRAAPSSGGPALRGPGGGSRESAARNSGRATQAEVGGLRDGLPCHGQSSANQLNVT